ncbi:MAG: zinc protease [Cognaticolwellia sp.]|jgi:zinc protease
MIALLALACIPPIPPGPSPAQERETLHAQVVQEIQGSQVVYLQATIRAGSAADPIGQEGVAYLTARMLREGGAGARSSAEVDALLSEMAATVQVIVDKDLVTLRGKAMASDADRFVPLFSDMLADPAWDANRFDQLREQSIQHLGTSLLADTEGLGDAALDNWLNEGHPYGHTVQGRTGALEVLTLEQAQAFYAKAYVRQAVTVGIGGDVAAQGALVDGLMALPVGRRLNPTPRSRPPVSGRSIAIIQGSGDSVGWHMGHPIDVGRDHPDYPALLLGLSAFGEHRQSWGTMFQVMRTERGLNYGDYAYLEHYRQVGWSATQELGTVRVQPQFSMWLRPIQSDNAAFALKLALSLSEQLIEEGLEPGHFERMQQSLVKRTQTLARDPGRSLGFAVDAAAMGHPNRLEMGPALQALTLEQVNNALRIHVHPDKLKIVGVAPDPEVLLATLLEDSSTPIVYADVTPSPEQDLLDSSVAASSAQLISGVVLPAQDLFR